MGQVISLEIFKEAKEWFDIYSRVYPGKYTFAELFEDFQQESYINPDGPPSLKPPSADKVNPKSRRPSRT
jgi:hypothetical protein